MNNIPEIYLHLKQFSIIRLSDSSFQLAEYLKKYFTYDLNEQEINDLYELIENGNQAKSAPAPVKAKATKPKSRAKKLSAKLVNA